MTKRRFFLLMSCVVMCCAIILWVSPARSGDKVSVGPTRVAVCDMLEIFSSYQRAKDFLAKLTQRRQEIQAESEKRAKAIESIQMELEGLKVGSSEYEQRLNEAQRLNFEHKAWLEHQDATVGREYYRLTKQMYEEVVQTVGQVAKDEGFQIVLYYQRVVLQSDNTTELLRQIERQKVIYSDEGLDITASVLSRLNEAYSSSKP